MTKPLFVTEDGFWTEQMYKDLLMYLAMQYDISNFWSKVEKFKELKLGK